MRHYNSIEEIDAHLSVLRQRADNYKKKADINTQLIKHSLTPSNLVAKGIVSMGETYLWQNVFNLVLNKFRLIKTKRIKKLKNKNL